MPGWFRVPKLLIDNGQVIGPCGIAVYCVLAYHAGADGRAWPSYDTIAREAGLSRRKAVSMVAALERLGLVKTERSPGRASNRYLLTGANGAPGAPFGGANGAPGAPQQCTPCTVNGAPGAPEQDPLEQDSKNKTPPTPQGGHGGNGSRPISSHQQDPEALAAMLDAVAEITGSDRSLQAKPIRKKSDALMQAGYTAADVRRLPAVMADFGFDLLTLGNILERIGLLKREKPDGKRHDGRGAGRMGRISRVEAPPGKYDRFK